MLELRSGEKSVRRPVLLNRDQKFGLRETVVKDFPWPGDAEDGHGMLMVRPLNDNDVPLLDSEQVSGLLAREHNFEAVPLQEDGPGGWRGQIRYTTERMAVRDPRTTWFLRIAEDGGVA